MARSRIAALNDRVLLGLRHRTAWDSASAAVSATGFGGLRDHKYALLTTFRRSGEPVPTPVWFGVGEDGNVYVRSESEVGKVKRIRNQPRVLLAPCTFRGRPLGPPAEGRARVLPPDEWDRAERAIAANYGAGRRVYESVGERVGGIDTVYVEVAPA